MFRRMCAAHMDEPSADADTAGEDAAERGEWAEVTLRLAAVQAARILLSFGGDVVVTSPPEVREDLLAVAASVIACYAPGAGPALMVSFPSRSAAAE
jgi:hypothetical protein